MLSKTLFAFGACAFLGVSATPWPFDLTTISAPDGSITAKFVSFGATMTELWVKDKNGKLRDIILGYDDNSLLLTDPAHPVFNPIVGRYANRIKNGTFSIPITKLPQPDGPNVYHIPTNDHNGEASFFRYPVRRISNLKSHQDTLHGGIYGWDRRNWTLVLRTPTSVTYKHVDTADEGFPGNVTAFATHTVSNGGVLNTVVRATATEKTPIMLTQHIYWNLDAFQDGSSDILSHHLLVDASRVIDVDGDAIPTGEFIDVGGTPFDFRQEQKIGSRWNDTINLCGGGCQGYDSCWVYDHPENNRFGTSLWSDLSGIRVDIATNQPAVQVYTSFWMNTPRKVVHGGPSLNYTKWSAVAIEQEGYIDAINTPEWNVDQIYYPGKDFEWSSTYKFSVVK
ncbi:putative aldose 1-epimerase [Lyophyllum shimeji]|uniref:Aldose 1-epimerase n=1 Tax=Lyophyllum shimeji TaxID=47721 RepID=A0A9P3UQ61_LYOSH|nr:putative aldose 1-epimerase [Lyophyllum shimeji]